MGEANIMITIGETKKAYEKGVTYNQIAKEHQSDFEHDIIAVFSNGKLTELSKTAKTDCTVSFVTTADDIGHKTYVRGLTMLLLKAVYAQFGRDNLKKVAVEYAIGNGYYCDIEGTIELTEENVKQIEQKMREFVEEDIPFEKSSINTEEAVEMFKNYGMYDKEKLFRYRRASRVNVYTLGHFEDYYYGAMPYSTGILTYFKLERYEDGIVLVAPNKKEPEKVSEFVPSPKLFHVFKESNEWGKKVDVDTVGALNDMIASGNLNELILTQEALHEKKIAEIAEDIYKKNKRLIMIAGPSSSGKTTFSYRLSVQLRTLGLKPHPIAVDDYFVNRVDTPRDENGKYNYECLEAIDVKQFNEDMLKLLNGESVQLPTYNFITGCREFNKPYKKLGENDVLVIEGIHGLNDKLSYALSGDDKYRIYISALTQLNIDEHNRIPTTDGRLIRRIVRDARVRGASAERTINMWNSVRRGEDENIFPFQEKADAMFNSALVYELAILKQYAEPLLFSVPKESEAYIEAKRLLKFLDYFLGVSSEIVPTNSILKEFIGGSVLVD